VPARGSGSLRLKSGCNLTSYRRTIVMQLNSTNKEHIYVYSVDWFIDFNYLVSR
jgi:hypothetical protein